MSKYIKPWRLLLFCSAQSTAFNAQMPSDHTAQSSELAYLSQEPQSRNEAQDLLRLQEYVCKLTPPEDTYALLQQSRPRGSVGIAALVCR